MTIRAIIQRHLPLPAAAPKSDLNASGNAGGASQKPSSLNAQDGAARAMQGMNRMKSMALNPAGHHAVNLLQGGQEGKENKSTPQEGQGTKYSNGPGGGINIDGNKVSVDRNINSSVKGKGGNFSWSLDGRTQESISRGDGKITYTVTASGSVSGKVSNGKEQTDAKKESSGAGKDGDGKADGKGKNNFDVSVGVSRRISANYTVVLPESAEAHIGSVDFTNPETMPVGTSVTMSSSQASGTSFEASFKNVFFASQTNQSEDHSIQIEAIRPNVVQVTAGPSSGINEKCSLGLKFGDFKVSAGSSFSLSEGHYKTATFDLNTPEGVRAYDEFLLNGKLPSDNGAGVSDVASVYSGKHAHKKDASVVLGDYYLNVSLPGEGGSVTEVEYPDGSVDATVSHTTQGEGGMTTTIKQSIRPQQDYPGGPTYMQEDVSARKYVVSFTVPENDRGMSGLLNLAASGDSNSSLFVPGQKVTLEFTHKDLEEMLNSARSVNTDEKNLGIFEDLLDSSMDGDPGTMDVGPHELFCKIFDGNAYDAANDLAEIANLSADGKAAWRLKAPA